MKIGDYMKRDVVSVPQTATLRDAAQILVDRHVGLLPVLDGQGRPVGVLGLRDLLSLALPSFVRLIGDFDFVHDFGAVEAARPSAETMSRPVTSLMRPATTVNESSGLLRAYTLMYKHELHDLPVVSRDGRLVGIASRVDLGTAVLKSWLLDEKASR
jgi:CBS domain-containing protein